MDWQLCFASLRDRDRTKAAILATFVESRAASHLPEFGHQMRQ